MSLDPELRPHIAPHLEAGETLAWAQRGPALRLSIPLLIPLSFALAWTLAAGAFTALVVWSVFQSDQDWGGPLIGGAMTMVGVGFTWWTWRGFKAGFSTIYAITDRAALIIEGKAGQGCRRFSPKDIAKRERFGDRIGFRPDVIDANAYDSTTSFIGVKHIAKAEALLDAIAPKEPQQ